LRSAVQALLQLRGEEEEGKEKEGKEEEGKEEMEEGREMELME
jgi:hypothetical protein